MIKVCVFAAAASLAAVVQAGTPTGDDGARSTVVEVGDLDVGSARGQSVLKRRVASAIEEVCGSYANVTEQSEIDEIDACRAGARASADRQLAERTGDSTLGSAPR